MREEEINGVKKLIVEQQLAKEVAQRLKKAGGLTLLAKRDQKEFNILS